MSQKVLLVGSSFSAVPIFFALKKLGFTVGVAGAKTEDPCHAYSDFSCFIDYSDRYLLLEAVRQHDVDYICPTCNDYSYVSCAWVAEQCGFPGFDTLETTDILHNKDKFRAFCKSASMPSPKVFTMLEGGRPDIDSADFPLLVKPVDSFSGRGVTKVLNDQELDFALEHGFRSSRTAEVLVEEFVEGSLHSYSVFIRNGKIAFGIFADEYCTVYPYQVNCSNIPSKLPLEVQNSVNDIISKLIDRLHLCDGLLHTQLLVDGGSVWLVECMRRAPGDLFYRMVELSVNVDGMGLYVRPFLGMEIPEVPAVEQYRPIARHTISVPKSIVFQSFTVALESGECLDVVPLKISGNILDEAPYDKLAIMFFCFESKESLFEVAPQLAEKIDFKKFG